MWRTQNNGSSWSQPGTYGLGDFTTWKLERDRISSSRLFLVTPMTVYTTTDSGATWSNIGGYTMPSPLLPSDRAHFVSDPAPFAQMVFDSSTRLLLWGPSCSGLMYSTNCTSFTQLWPFTGGGGEARNCINAIAVDGQSHHVFYSAMTTTSPAGTQGGGTYVSSDEGDTWTAWGPSWSAPPRAVLRIAFSSQSGGTSWIASTDGLHRKVGAGSWSLVAGGSGYTVNDVAVDPLCPRRVYIALGFAARTAYHRGGINITEDNGDNWYSTTAGLDLHQAPIADVEVQPGNSRYIYAAVFGQGVWKMDRGSTPTCP